ncbi:MAG TPA: MerR family transcriptional regulator [Longimicrobiaceae bacterium]|nr:MerR family transcriptional regulator [Longimicrobiaceae bacterium]
MREETWKVGELARSTGLTVRTLHHYDRVGLLSPSRRTASGHRLYVAADVARLQQIRSLRELGFSLDEVREFLERPDASPRRVVQMHVERLREQIAMQSRLCERLEAVAASLDRAEEVSAADLLRTIEMMTMYERYYTPGQLEELKRRRETVGEERIREVEAEWPRLIAEVRAEMQRGTDPAEARVRELALRWMGLVREFTGGDPEIARAAQRLNEDRHQELREQHGDAIPTPDVMEYIGRAMAAAGIGHP